MFPLGRCEGDCDNDSECEVSLKEQLGENNMISSFVLSLHSVHLVNTDNVIFAVAHTGWAVVFSAKWQRGGPWLRRNRRFRHRLLL